MDDVVPRLGVVKRPSSSLLTGNKSNATDTKKEGFPISFRHLGRKGGYELTLFASTMGSRKKWLEYIDEQQEKLRARGDFYNKTTLSAGFFTAMNRVNCAAPFDGGRKLIYGTDTGIYVSDRRSREAGAKPKRVIDVQNVTQVDVLEEYQLLLVLSAKSLLSFPLSALDPNEPTLGKRSKKIQSHCNFFKTGICLGRHLVCCVKSSALSTTIKVFEPNDAMSKGKKQKGFKMFNSGQDELKAFKEFYIPTESSSIHFLKSKLCVACARGFEVVSLETLETQSLLDQADTSLDFVARKENVRPIHIERLNGEFLLNYSEFSFFVNRNGWRARPDWRIEWEGLPQSFALSYPWILAFEPNFVEIRNIETQAVHIIPAKNTRMLHTSTREVRFSFPPPTMFQMSRGKHTNNPGRSSTPMKTSAVRISSLLLTSGLRVNDQMHGCPSCLLRPLRLLSSLRCRLRVVHRGIRMLGSKWAGMTLVWLAFVGMALVVR